MSSVKRKLLAKAKAARDSTWSAYCRESDAYCKVQVARDRAWSAYRKARVAYEKIR